MGNLGGRGCSGSRRPRRYVLGNGARDLIPSSHRILANVLSAPREVTLPAEAGFGRACARSHKSLGRHHRRQSPAYGRVAALDDWTDVRRAWLDGCHVRSVSTSGTWDCNFWRWYSDSNMRRSSQYHASLGYRFTSERSFMFRAMPASSKPVPRILTRAGLRRHRTRAENRSLFLPCGHDLAVGSFKSTTN